MGSKICDRINSRLGTQSAKRWARSAAREARLLENFELFVRLGSKSVTRIFVMPATPIYWRFAPAYYPFSALRARLLPLSALRARLEKGVLVHEI